MDAKPYTITLERAAGIIIASGFPQALSVLEHYCHEHLLDIECREGVWYTTPLALSVELIHDLKSPNTRNKWVRVIH